MYINHDRVQSGVDYRIECMYNTCTYPTPHAGRRDRQEGLCSVQKASITYVTGCRIAYPYFEEADCKTTSLFIFLFGRGGREYSSSYVEEGVSNGSRVFSARLLSFVHTYIVS